MATSAPSFKPAVPTMGALEQTSSTDFCPWVGGKPKADWSGLEATTPTRKYDGQLRPTSPGSAQKSTAYRSTGIDSPFAKGDNFLDFIAEIWDLMQMRGLDTIAYLQDPTDPTKMISILEYHSRYTLDSAKKAAMLNIAKYDRYDISNDDIAKRFLLNSIAADIKKDVNARIKASDGFAVTWMEFVSQVQAISYKEFSQIKQWYQWRVRE